MHTDRISPNPPDRYISFADIDVAGMSRRLMACIDQHLTHPERHNAFWRYFNARRYATSGPRHDDLYLLHAHINQVRELFETWDDAAALVLLEEFETQCC